MSFWHVILVRSVFSFFFLLLIARILGKKQISQMTFFDYIVGITIGSTASTLAVEMENPTLNAVLGMLVYALLAFLIAVLTTKSNWVDKFIDGEPTVLVEKGKVLENNMFRNRITMNELTSLLRQKNAFNISDVEYAILETDGQLSVQKKAEKEPLAPGDIGLKVPYKGLPEVIILDGKMIMHRLRELGLTQAWVKEKLAHQGIQDIRKVFTAQVDSNGEIYADTYDDVQGAAEPDTSNSQMLASLSGLMADLETYSLETDNQEAKQMYETCRRQVENIVQEFRPYVEKQLIKKGEDRWQKE